MSEQRLIDATALEQDLISKGFYPAIVKRAIENAPTIDPVRQGEWENNSGYDDWYCSECGFEINYDGEYPTEYDNFKYCGCCGARMDGE